MKKAFRLGIQKTRHGRKKVAVRQEPNSKYTQLNLDNPALELLTQWPMACLNSLKPRFFDDC